MKQYEAFRGDLNAFFMRTIL
ncbi:hypothetical protein CY0110_18027 [Crocosphaera chwakensis CCY0110]|uniref:Uncharacterized protein n=1 Tax=Crocosphaera chwakensis CCY0110 TaxID=391612 RepID=A3IIT7_9CHRO|nr:hypothetical protein CY0110_18027 [Crocosphaera chwakensis CCY0110]